MANFIYDEKQKKAINLDNVDTIKRDKVDGVFQIVFQKQLTVKTSYLSTTLDRWAYPTEKERDDMFYKILGDNGNRVDPHMPLIA